MKKIAKKIKKFTVIALLIATIISSIPLASALTSDTKKKNNVTSSGEILDKREKFSKQFQNEDGTITAVNYVDAIHYQDDNGNWKDIDNSLIDVSNVQKKMTSLSREELDKYYVNKDNPYTKFMFNKKTSETNLIKVNADGYEIAWGLSNLNEVSSTVLNNDSRADKYNLTNLKSGVKYENALTNADLYYYITSNNLKEEIILKEKSDIKELVYNIKTTLTPVATDTSMVVFLNENEEVVFAFQAPYMYDSAESSSMTYETSVEVVETEDGYKLIYTLDTEWLNDEDRVYPITIDPTVTNGRSQVSVEDTYVHPNDSLSHYHVNEDRLWVGKVNTTSRAFINWGSMPSIPSNADITYAYVSFNLFKGTTTWGPLSLYQINSSWDSTKLTWAIHNNLYYTELLTNLYPTQRDGYYNYQLNVTNTVKGWYNRGVAKNGFMIRYTNESYNDYNTIVSSDSGTNSNYWPCIYITYNIPNSDYKDLGWQYPVNTAYTGLCSYHIDDHPAIDICTRSGQASINGQNIYAAQSGIVNYAGFDYSGGYWISVKSNDTNNKGYRITYNYMHMQSQASKATGATVNKGDYIGKVGASGNANGAHLHFETYAPNVYKTVFGASNYPGFTIDPREFYSLF